jgi:hypothetical protein
MKYFVAALLALTVSLAHASPLNVTIWKPELGKTTQMLEHAMAAKAIQEKLGATVSIAMENTGNMHYAVAGFKDWQSWAKYIGKLQKSKDWAAWQASAGEHPASEQIENYILDVATDAGSDGGVYQVFIWEPNNGRIGAMVESAMQAKAIHEKSGASVTIAVDQMRNMHYVMNFKDLAAWAKTRDNPNPEFQAFMAKQAYSPNGDLIKVYTASRLP